jgi:hypothetical protein
MLSGQQEYKSRKAPDYSSVVSVFMQFINYVPNNYMFLCSLGRNGSVVSRHIFLRVLIYCAKIHLRPKIIYSGSFSSSSFGTAHTT